MPKIKTLPKSGVYPRCRATAITSPLCHRGNVIPVTKVLYQKKLFRSCNFVKGQFSISWMGHVDGLVESLLDLDFGMNQMVPSDRRFDLVENAGEADGVVVGDDSLMLGAEDRRQM